jgi:hypothetical protein
MEKRMTATHSAGQSRRAFCLCCLASAGFAATGGLGPRQAFAEARGLVSLIKDSAATAPIVAHKLRNNISALEGSGGNIAVHTGPDGKVLVDAGGNVVINLALAQSAPISALSPLSQSSFVAAADVHAGSSLTDSQPNHAALLAHPRV